MKDWLKEEYIFLVYIPILSLTSILFFLWDDIFPPLKNECKKTISETLKTPSTAKFSNFKKIGENIGIYDVDAQNGFGTYLRNTYLCTNETFLGTNPALSVKHLKGIEDLSENNISACIKKSMLSDEENVFDKCIEMEIHLLQKKLTNEKNCQDAKDFFEKGDIDQETLNFFCNK